MFWVFGINEPAERDKLLKKLRAINLDEQARLRGMLVGSAFAPRTAPVPRSTTETVR